MIKVKVKSVWLFCLLVSLSACAAAPKPMNPLELMVKGVQCFADHDPAVTIYTVPSRGAIADRLGITAAKSAGNDGGFSEAFKNLVAKGNKRFVFYSTNSEKMSVEVDPKNGTVG